MSGGPPAAAAEVLRAAARLGDAPLPIAEAALAFAALDRPDLPLDRCRAELDRIARTVAARPADEPAAERLAGALAGEFGFRGDSETYDDLANADLARVLDRRRGLPVTLGILYIHAARAQGWEAEGLNFPNHFLVRATAGADRAILDPFNGGRRMEAPDLRALLRETAGPGAALAPGATAAVPDRHVLLRLRNNIKLRLYRAGRLAEGLAVLESAMLLAPDLGELKREAGLVNARLGNLGAAIRLLDAFLDDRPDDGPARREAESLLRGLRARLN